MTGSARREKGSPRRCEKAPAQSSSFHSSVTLLSLSWFLARWSATGRLSPQASRLFTPILKKVSPELLATTDPAVRIREPGLVPIDQEFRLGDRQKFARISPADHVDARARYSKTDHRSHEQSRRVVCHDRLHPQGTVRSIPPCACEVGHTPSHLFIGHKRSTSPGDPPRALQFLVGALCCWLAHWAQRCGA
jgi:hypothetical protein